VDKFHNIVFSLTTSMNSIFDVVSTQNRIIFIPIVAFYLVA